MALEIKEGKNQNHSLSQLEYFLIPIIPVYLIKNKQRNLRKMRPSFIRTSHPKTEIKPKPETIERILKKGWVGQIKIHGHRAQIHFNADEKMPPIAFTRKGGVHSKPLSPKIIKELRRIFKPKKGWSVIDAEWIKTKDKIYIFDYLKKDDQPLKKLTYQKRYSLLPRNYISPFFTTLPLLETVKKCIHAMEGQGSLKIAENIEGLVLKSLHTPGFEDTSIIRCTFRDLRTRYVFTKS